MDGPLLATKLHAPARRPASVIRTRLTGRLEHPARLVLVAAPAGFGKTSVLTEWLASRPAGTRVAWLSLDERDDDATQFWRYLLAAIEVAIPGVTGAARAALESAAPTEAVLATLVNDLHFDGGEAIVVLDDLHVIESPAVHEGIAFLVDHLPGNVRLVIASRVDPPLPLARLRVRGELLELRAADLRFAPDEVAQYLDAMGLAVADADAAALGDRTEGWIAALQLAALSLQGRDDASAFIEGFAGDDRFVVDYLVEEVLHRQPDAVRDFLLSTSILGRLSGDLCDAVTEGAGSAARLDALDRANLFLVPLDDQREWYRYHHLFAEMLRARLLDERRDDVADLHVRASAWFERHGHPTDAIVHALDAGAFDRAAALIKTAMPAMQRQRQEQTLANWFELLPTELVRADPELGIGFAGVLLSSGRTDGVDALLLDAEAAAGTSTGIVALRRGIALYRAAQTLTGGDVAASLEHSAIAVGLAAEGTHLDRGSAHGIRGLALWALGDLEAAREAWSLALDALERAGHLADVLGGSIAMGDILVALGRLGDAEELFRRGLALSASAGPPLRGTADMHVGLAGILRERGDLDGAREQLAAAEALGEYAGLPQNRHRRRMASARLLLSDGNAAAGIPLLDEAEALYTPDFFPEVQPIRSLRARLRLAAGLAEEARARRAVDLSYLAEFEHVTLARVLLVDSPDDALGLLDRLLAAAEDGGRRSAAIELLVLRSLALAATGSEGDALDALGRAVTLAEPEGFVRVFADEGAAMSRLLGALAKRTGTTAYLRRLQAAIGPRREGPRPSALLDPLSERELDVLRYLASELTGPEIARQLFVSLNTLRTHTKHLYAKLGATSRREAVRRATDLGLLTPR